MVKAGWLLHETFQEDDDDYHLTLFASLREGYSRVNRDWLCLQLCRCCWCERHDQAVQLLAHSLEEHVRIWYGAFSALLLLRLSQNQQWLLFESDQFLDFLWCEPLSRHPKSFSHAFWPPNRRLASESLITWVALASIRAPGIRRGSISLMKEETIDLDGGWWKRGGGVSFWHATTMSKRDKIQKSHGRLIWVQGTRISNQIWGTTSGLWWTSTLECVLLEGFVLLQDPGLK